MKNLISIILISICCAFVLNAQNKNHNNEIQNVCCDHIVVTATKNGCCLDINIYLTGLCNEAIRFYSSRKENGNYEFLDSTLLQPSESTVMTVCPDGDSLLDYRIYASNPINFEPYGCGDVWAEGITMFNGTANFAECCSCPEVKDFVLHEVTESPDCPDECKVNLSWNLNDSLTCYTHYYIERPSEWMDDIVAIDSIPISQQDFCLGHGESDTVKVYLLKGYDVMQDICEYEFIVSGCDTSDCGCPVIKDFVKTELSVTDFCPDECHVRFDWNWNDSLDCYTHYRLEMFDSLGTMSGMQNVEKISTVPISNQNFCLTPGETRGVIITLFKEYPDFEDKCSYTFYITGCDPSLADTIPYDTTGTNPCTDDCEEVPWIKEKRRLQIRADMNVFGNNCWANVYFAHRTACGKQEVQITKVEYEEGCLDTNKLKEGYASMIRQLIAANPMGFLPTGVPPDTCNSTWEVSMGSCFAEFKIFIPKFPFGTREITIRLNCEENSCCTKWYEVCRIPQWDPLFNKEFHLLSIEELGGTHLDSCETSFYMGPLTTDPGGIPCNPVCDWLDLVPGDFYDYSAGGLNGKFAVNDYFDEIDEEYVKDIIQLNDRFEFGLEFDGFGDVTFSVYDLSGNIKVNHNLEVLPGRNDYIIDLTQLHTGTYLYMINVNGRIIYSDKFIIVR